MRYSRIIRAAALVLAALVLAAAMPAALADGESLTILFTTDIHANVMPYRALLDGEVRSVGGFARLKTAIDALTDGEDTLLLDAGDFFIGTMFQNFFPEGSVELPIMDELGYDAIALGNHDFDYGEEGLRQCLKSFRDKGGTHELLCANLIEKGGAVSGDRYTNPMADVGVANYTIVERAGLRIGLFGLMGEDAESYIVTEDYDFADPAETAKTYVRVLRETEKVDLVILLSHLGTVPGTAWTEDEDLAEKVEGIDLIVSGHSHAALDEPIRIGDTSIVCAGTALKSLGRLRIVRENGAWRIAEHALIPLTEDFAEDPALSAKIADYQRRIDEEYLGYYGVPETSETIVAASPCTFPNGDEMCTALATYPFSQLIMDAYDYALTQLCHEEVDAAMLAVGGVRSTLYEGGVSVAEIYNALGYGDSPVDGKSGSPVVTAYVTGRELYDLAETSASLSSIVSAAQIFFAGLRYTLDEGRPLMNRVYLVELRDSDTGEYRAVARDDTLYKIACSYSAANLVSLVKSNSYGLFSVEFKDENGAPVSGEALLSRIVHYALPSGEARELKEWYALYAYIMQFPVNAAGLHEIPASYGVEPADYMRVTDEGLKVFFKSPTKPARIVLIALVVLLLLIALILVLCLHRRRRKRAKAA